MITIHIMHTALIQRILPELFTWRREYSCTPMLKHPMVLCARPTEDSIATTRIDIIWNERPSCRFPTLGVSLLMTGGSPFLPKRRAPMFCGCCPERSNRATELKRRSREILSSQNTAYALLQVLSLFQAGISPRKFKETFLSITQLVFWE